MKIKYFIRGLGVGILITALLVLIGSSRTQKVTISDEEVIDRAKQLGMIAKEDVGDYRLDKNLDQMKEDLANTESPEPEQTTIPATTAATKAPEKEDNKKTSKPTVSPSSKPKKKDKKQEKSNTITLTIESGMTTQAVSRILHEKNVIRNEEDFVTYMVEHKLTAKLQVGKYEIPVDATHAQIADIITKK